MANRFPIILDTNDKNRLKELPNGDSLDLANGGIRNATFVETAQLILAGTTLTPFSGAYTDLTGKPSIPSDISSLTDSQSLLTGTTFANLTGKPTTLSGYGITDAFNGTYAGLSGSPTLAALATSGAFSDVTGKPTTTTGYGITNALTASSFLKNLADVHTVVPTDGQLLSWDNSNSYWKPITASGTGTVTSVVGGSGLTGGTITSAGTLAVDTGTTANKVVQLDASAKLPRVDGSELFNLYVASINDVGDTTITSPTNGQVLKYNGEKWVNATNSGDGGSITFVGDDSTGTSVDGSETFKIAGGTNITTAVSGDTLTITATAITKAQVTDLLTSDFNVGANKILYSNVYTNLGDLPAAGSYHGMFAHVHNTGQAYFAHGGVWLQLAQAGTTIADYGITDAQAALVSGTNLKTINGASLLGGGNITISGGGGSIGNFTFASSVIDTDDSSGVVITPAVTISSDLTVENNLTVSNTVTAAAFISQSAGTPEVRSATNLDLYAANAVRIQNGTLTLFNATSTARDALSAVKGDVIYNSTVNRTQVYTGASWVNNALSTDIPTNTNQLTNGAAFATLASPTFTGTVSGVSSTMVGLGNVTNESKTTMFTDPNFTGNVSGVTKANVGLSNATNESKATMFTDPTFTGTMAGTFSGTVQNTFSITNSGSSDYVFAGDAKFFTANTNQLTNGAGFAPLASPTFTGTVSGVSSTMVGLGNVTNESKSSMFTDPNFSGNVTGVTKANVGLSNATNESKATMFTDPTFTGTMAGTFGGTVQNTFNITNSGSSDYAFAGDAKFFASATNDPVLYLTRGETYKFVVNATGHPFQIRASNGGSAYNTGVTNNGQANATITFVVPMSAPATLYYQCTAHSGMGGVINIVGAASGSYANSDVDTHLNQSGPTSGYVLSWNGSDYAWVANTGSAAALYGAETTGGVDPTASGTLSLAIGSGAVASATWATAIGKGSTASATYSAALGNGAKASATFAVALGGSVAAGDRSFAAVIDDVSGTYGAKGLGSIAIGKQATATGNNSVAIGKDAVATQDQITLGDSTATVKIPGLLVAGIFTLTASGSSHYVYAQDDKFFTAAANDPVLYLRRGDTYIFINNSGGGHPFQIRASNGGSAYSTGVTNNGASSGEIIFTVPMGAPSTLYYQCTAHSAMGGVINIV